MRKILLILALISGMHLCVDAQVDPHFSQYYVYPSWLNPALTGAFDGDIRINGIYRNQWNSITNAFSTAGVSADFVTSKNINIGGSFMRQTAGTGGYTYTTGNISLAYTGIHFDAAGYQRLVFGVQGGLISRKFDRSKFELDDQWTSGGGFNAGTTTIDQFSNTSTSVFDAGAGLLFYDADPRKKANVFVGVSGSHLTQPDDAFTTGPVKSKLPIRYTAHGGVRISLSDVLSITPNLLYLRQGNAEEKMAGAYAQIKAGDQVDFLLGANYRFNDAIVPFAGFYYKNLTLGVSYDVNNSDLKRSVTTANSFEISLSYIIRKPKTLDEKHFICPRL
jgi:type IX secretion system PorP/SprF family membrane protein